MKLCILLVALLAKPWYAEVALEDAVNAAELIMAARVSEVTEVKLVHGGKGEETSYQFKFKPLRTLKGVFAREELSLTSADLGAWSFQAEIPQLKVGQVRLLLLGRSRVGYANINHARRLDTSLPPLTGENDPLLDSVTTLAAVTQEPDRARKVGLLLEALRLKKGPPAVPLLSSLRRRALLAMQTPGSLAVVSAQLADDRPAVREAAAQTLRALLDADYLGQSDLYGPTVEALVAALQRPDADLAARDAALQALAFCGPAAHRSEPAMALLRLDAPSSTFAERAARLHALGRLKAANQAKAVSDYFAALPLDAPRNVLDAGAAALAALDPAAGAAQILGRVKARLAAGLDAPAEILQLTEFQGVADLELGRAERVALAQALERRPDPGQVPILARLLDPAESNVRHHAVNALLKIGTVPAATALAPRLREEQDILRKLQIAELLGRHGIRDGYPYAIEHMSEASLREQAVAALAAIREPGAVAQLRNILKTSNNTAWNSAALLALGRLGDKESVPQALELIQNLRHPLAGFALLALADLGEAGALPKAAEALKSRDASLVVAGARAAAKLQPGDPIRDELAALLADADADLEARAAALEALLALNDPRLNRALSAAARDGHIEQADLLRKVEVLLRERKVKLD